MADSARAIVIDNGSGYIKAGFSDEKQPSHKFLNVVGRPKVPGIMIGSEQKDYFCGHQAEEKRGILILKTPIEHGIIEDFDDMEKIWDHTFTNELRVVPEEHKVLMTDAPLNPKVNKERTLQILFDTFQVNSFYLANSASLALYSTGVTTGTIVDSGDGVSHVVPIIDGSPIESAIQRINIAGRDITDYLVKILSERGLHLTTSFEREIVKRIKEQLCFVAHDFNDSLSQSKSGTLGDSMYEMPDGSVITIGSEKFRASEILFTPSLVGKEFAGLPVQVFQSIQKCDVDLRQQLYSNIFLSGGNTCFQGIEQRLTSELKKLVNQEVKVSGSSNYITSTWVGGAVLSQLSSFQQDWITKDQYNEIGPSIVHRHCL